MVSVPAEFSGLPGVSVLVSFEVCSAPLYPVQLWVYLGYCSGEVGEFLGSQSWSGWRSSLFFLVLRFGNFWVLFWSGYGSAGNFLLIWLDVYWLLCAVQVGSVLLHLCG